ncbi:GntR family transcriptional regulator [Pseudolabrys sp. FHR47]|uniref:GntR family transcriptional regulator n=1 Tax=Pseudolabrys sp. FHR47 TaxID=2562284 RepID=UPI0010BEFF7B|nr:FCD domain-containing protein [Pseudolabrys sp. FHR47]
MARTTSMIDEGTIGERAYRRIRNDILFGRLKPSEKLKLERLKDDYGVSVSTLREVLSRLASEKLVVAEGQRGFEVAPVSAEDLKDIASLRLLLEVHAIAQSFQSGDMEWEARVVAAHHKLAAMEEKKKSEGSPDAETWKRYDWEFHQALISACGSCELMETHGAVFDKYLRYQVLALTDRGDIAAREHKQLMQCALKRDAAKAGEVLKAHINGGLEHALAVGKIV